MSSWLASRVLRAWSGMFFNPPCGSRTTFFRWSSEMVSPIFAPLMAAKISGRKTFSSLSGFPNADNPTVTTTWLTQGGMGGSWAAGALSGRKRDPSASTSTGKPKRSATRQISAVIGSVSPSRRPRPSAGPVNRRTPLNSGVRADSTIKLSITIM